MNLDIDKDQQAAMNAAEIRAWQVLKEVMDGDYDGNDDAKPKIRAAQSVISAQAKNRQTMTSREAFRFSVASTLGDSRQIGNYVSATMPQIAKQMTG